MDATDAKMLALGMLAAMGCIIVKLTYSAATAAVVMAIQ